MHEAGGADGLSRESEPKPNLFFDRCRPERRGAAPAAGAAGVLKREAGSGCDQNLTKPKT